MNLEKLHCDILELKLLRAEIIVRKKHLIKMQRYEEVANEREREREILKNLGVIQGQLEHFDGSLALTKENLRRKQEIRNLLIELNPVDHAFATDSLAQIEKQIVDLKKERNSFLANKDQEGAEPLITELHDLFQLRMDIDSFIRQRDII